MGLTFDLKICYEKLKYLHAVEVTTPKPKQFDEDSERNFFQKFYGRIPILWMSGLGSQWKKIETGIGRTNLEEKKNVVPHTSNSNYTYPTIIYADGYFDIYSTSWACRVDIIDSFDDIYLSFSALYWIRHPLSTCLNYLLHK